MKITQYTINIAYTTEQNGSSETFSLTYSYPVNCDVSELGKRVGERLQKSLDAHCTKVVEAPPKPQSQQYQKKRGR